jgi:hypothetical protein
MLLCYNFITVFNKYNNLFQKHKTQKFQKENKGIFQYKYIII